MLVSKGFANPVIRDMYMFPPHNDKLEPERMMNYELAYFKRAANGTFGANIFIVDGKEGINPIDYDIANILRQAEKPIYLAPIFLMRKNESRKL